MNDDYFLCPKCGNDVKVGAPHCPTCPPPKKRKKATPKSWEQGDHLDGLNLPDQDFDYDKFIADEFESGPAHRRIGIAWYWWVTALILLIGFLIFAFGSIFN